MAAFPPLMQLLRMAATQTCCRQQLERTPEPAAVTDQDDHVAQYDQVMTTKLALAYGAALEIIHRVRPVAAGGVAIDLACGPGHFSLNLARYLKLDELLGIDLSEPMVCAARANAERQGLPQARFQVGDITRLGDVPDAAFDLASFTDAAHHLPALTDVERVIAEMERITKPDGVLFVMDLARLRSRSLTERYVNVLGKDYVARGLPSFLADFRASMFAAWTTSELRQAIPTSSRRRWRHLVPRFLPTIQILIGLPQERKRLFERRGLPWGKGQHPLPPELRLESRIMSQSLRWGALVDIAPLASANPAAIRGG